MVGTNHRVVKQNQSKREIISTHDRASSAAMLSLGGIKALFSHGKPRPDANSLRG